VENGFLDRSLGYKSRTCTCLHILYYYKFS